MNKKCCKICHKEKSFRLFYQQHKRWYSSYCKSCHCEYDRKRYQGNLAAARARGIEYHWRNRAAVLERNRFRRYGITTEQFSALLKKQLKCCAICKSKKPGGSGTWHVDHKHGTKIVRGLLCNNCNIGIGYLKDSHKVLIAAARYLKDKA